MATAKQLAALAKGRAARAKKVGVKKTTKTPTKRKAAVVKKNPITPAAYVVSVVNSTGKTGYLSSIKPAFDTEKNKALVFAQGTGDKVVAELQRMYKGAVFALEPSRKKA